MEKADIHSIVPKLAGPEDCRERTHWDLPRSAPNNVRPPQFRAIHGQSIPLDCQSEGMTQQGWMTHRMDG